MAKSGTNHHAILRIPSKIMQTLTTLYVFDIKDKTGKARDTVHVSTYRSIVDTNTPGTLMFSLHSLSLLKSQFSMSLKKIN